jgi:hypothetical protein
MSAAKEEKSFNEERKIYLLQVKTFENLLLLAERSPWDKTWRALAGFLLVPVLRGIHGEYPSARRLITSFFWVLVALRILPMMIRRLLPFSAEAKSVWLERRLTAKRYDSYQWQKLFWIGLGLAAYGVLFRKWKGVVGFLAGFCLIGGGAGLRVWRAHQLTSPSEQPRPGKAILQ